MTLRNKQYLTQGDFLIFGIISSKKYFSAEKQPG
jgi:hypothetical protein